MYKEIIRPILFKFNPELIHNLTLRSLGLVEKIPGGRALLRMICKREHPALATEVFGIKFPNPVGLAGGMDKNGRYYNVLSDLGFGYVEIGSLTSKPQKGNPKPRIFRLPQDHAIINRMGINNEGVIAAIDHIKENKPEVVIAANISKNASSQGEQIQKDYLSAFSLLYDVVDFFVVNVSCPNVEGLTGLQDIGYLSEILDGILDKRAGMDKYRPVLVKVSLDVTTEQLDDILDYSLRNGIDGMVAGNTTRRREGLTTPKERIDQIGNGGLSGAPLYERSLAMVKYIKEKTQGRLPIVGVGGIMSPAQSKEMLQAGASLIEVYTGFIYEGPLFIKNILQELDNKQVKQND